MSGNLQLPLAVYLRDDATWENFLFGEALAPLRATLAQQRDADGELAVYLYGGPGSGRSHLLQAACQRVPAGNALYLPLEQLCTMSADEVLADIENMTLLCLDNLDAIAGDAQWEAALFHLLNRARSRGCRLLFSASCAPRELGVRLADLQSRLSWGVVFGLPDYSDQDKLQILQFRAARRGMNLGDEAGRYIMARAARSLGELIQLLEQLDKASMAAKRQLSVPFIRETLFPQL